MSVAPMSVPVVEVGTQLSTASADSTRSALRDGQLELGSAPGLGWELDLDFVERFRVSAGLRG